ncbi:MAG: hypothetical protein RIR11_4182 [Bacteroidota bacterium]
MFFKNILLTNSVRKYWDKTTILCKILISFLFKRKVVFFQKLLEFYSALGLGYSYIGLN